MKRRLGAARFAARTFLSAVVLNFAWEMAQAPLYEPMGTAWQATRRCLIASLGDGLMILLVVAAGATMFRSSRGLAKPALAAYAFAAVAGLILGVAVEQWGLATERWAYLPSMPRVPGIDIGVVPLMQLTLLAPLSLWLAGLWNRQTTR